MRPIPQVHGVPCMATHQPHAHGHPHFSLTSSHSFPMHIPLIPISLTISPPSHPTFMLRQTDHSFYFYPLIPALGKCGAQTNGPHVGPSRFSHGEFIERPPLGPLLAGPFDSCGGWMVRALHRVLNFVWFAWPPFGHVAFFHFPIFVFFS
ncbi:hypothetical protein PVL29_002443 [Vitis rotundifolia]|uniref:Uncharacterized protein n=1 Tax=Vitis rotundifolia TaxID=103349 RepID=A0AA39E834_VITRO|nr:hypothetical protein PVL29_002443 [Vitis rotundifolia]